eukprot:875676-Rhodomonas_salina.1
MHAQSGVGNVIWRSSCRSSSEIGVAHLAMAGTRMLPCTSWRLASRCIWQRASQGQGCEDASRATARS